VKAFRNKTVELVSKIELRRLKLQKFLLFENQLHCSFGRGKGKKGFFVEKE
jgi:hypothetical protein